MSHDGHRKVAGGTLHKWTNYMTGWQPRYFEIREGILQYYRSKAERSAGCRGAMSLKSSRVQHTEDFNKCEFSIRVNDDIVWYLKADTTVERDRWIRRLTTDYDSDYSSKSHSRTPSAASSTLSQAETGPSPSHGIPNREVLIAERIVELGNYRELCASQMSEIEHDLEQVSRAESSLSKQKLLTLKATHIAMLSNVDRILQLAAETAEMAPVHKPISSSTSHPQGLSRSRSDMAPSNGKAYQPSLPSPVLPVRRLGSDSDRTMIASSSAHSSTSGTINGVLSDEEECWQDAVSDRVESSMAEFVTAHENASSVLQCEAETRSELNGEKLDDRHLPFGSFDTIAVPESHNLLAEVERLTNEQLDYALTGASDPAMWTLFASDGEMRMYKRELEMDGMPVDPLKAHHSVKGVTALEFMHHFFDAAYKMDWDHTLEGMRVVEKISPDLVVIHQKHKTVWPAAPRESLFWSHIRRVDQWKSPAAYDCYVVCNKDIKRDDVPLGSSSALRVGLTVSMICETYVENPDNLPLSQLKRSAFSCKVIYVSSVHPGGWVPTSALRHVYKREYPKFLRTFTAFVQERVKNQARVAI